MYTIVPKTRISFDSRLFCKNIVVLALKISHYFLETERILSKLFVLSEKDGRMFVVNVVSEPRGINDGKRDSNTILLKLCKEYSDKSGINACTTQFKNH